MKNYTNIEKSAFRKGDSMMFDKIDSIVLGVCGFAAIVLTVILIIERF